MAQVRTRKRGKTFSCIFEAGKINGKRKVVGKGGFPSKSAAYTDFLYGNIGIVSESITLKDFVTKWLTNVVALNVKASSMQAYRTFFKNQIVPYLGETQADDGHAKQALYPRRRLPDSRIVPMSGASSGKRKGTGRADMHAQ